MHKRHEASLNSVVVDCVKHNSVALTTSSSMKAVRSVYQCESTGSTEAKQTKRHARTDKSVASAVKQIIASLRVLGLCLASVNATTRETVCVEKTCEDGNQ